MTEHSISLTERQGKHIEQILIQRQAIERDYANAVSLLADFDIPEGAGFRYEQSPPRIVVTLPPTEEPDGDSLA
jgi:hypothetical protein